MVEEITSAFANSQTAYDKYRENGLRPEISSITKGPNSLPLPMGGHTRRRSVGHKNSGLAFGHANWNALVKENKIEYLEDCWVIDLVTSEYDEEGKTVEGAIIYDAQKGKLLAICAPSVVMAAGGLSTLYFPKTDTMRGNTGDSYAIAAEELNWWIWADSIYLLFNLTPLLKVF